MKRIVASVFFIFGLPLLVWSQPLISNLEPHQQKEQLQKQDLSLSESDIIPSVLMLNQSGATYDNDIQKLFTEKPGIALLSSGLIPGSGQMVNKNWIRGGLYAALEIAAIYMVVEFDNRGDRGQQRYETYADQNWSVTQYAKWLVDYHDVNNLENSSLENLRSEVDGLEPAFNTDIDWENIDIEILRAVERQSRFVTPDNLSNSNFSHILPAYGSQQYYELISKYYQFQAGWRNYCDPNDLDPDVLCNFNNPDIDYVRDLFLISRNGDTASSMFFRGASLAGEFNNDLRTAKNFRLVLIANHLLSAFDSFFTFKLKQNRIQATTSMAPNRYLHLSVNF